MNYKKNEAKVYKLIKQIEIPNGGVRPSELLFMVSIIEKLDITLIIESGREKGYSTDFLSKFFPDYTIQSVDCDKKSKPKLNLNAELYFGDSRKLVPSLITEECVVFIDGPKDDEGIRLAVSCLRNPLVKGVFVHDLPKGSFCRLIWDNITVGKSADDETFQDKYGYLDNGMNYPENYKVSLCYSNKLTENADLYMNYSENVLEKALIRLKATGVAYKLLSKLKRIL